MIKRRYNTIHKWLFYKFGSANKCENSTCSKKSTHYEWSLLKNKRHAKKRENYHQLCRSCHWKYDDNEKLRKIMSRSRMGQIAWNKGLTKTDPRVAKYGLLSGISRKGKPTWNKGKHLTLAHKNKISETKKYRYSEGRIGIGIVM